MKNEEDSSNGLLKSILIRDETKLLESMGNRILISSDAGVKDEIGGFGCIFSLGDDIVLECKNRVPEIYNKLHSHRGEGVGILIASIILQKIHRYVTLHNITTFTNDILIQCDNKSMVDSVNKCKREKSTAKKTLLPDFDIIREIAKIIKNLNRNQIRIWLIHIKGHQDRDTNISTSEAKMNVQAD
jgi:hypothetical protein